MDKFIKELIDQSAHFGLGFGLVLLVLFYPLAIAPVIGAFAMYREYRQHGKLIWWNMDLAFWNIGITVAVLTYYFLIKEAS